MAPWPLIGYILTRHYMDQPEEVFLLLGGVTLIPIVLLMAIGFPAVLAEPLLVVIWIAVATAPWAMRSKHVRHSIMHRGKVYVAQSAISLIQAAFGAFLLLVKDV